MLSKIISIIERLLYSIQLRYRKYAFLSKIKSNEHSVNILGKIYVNASNIKIGKNVKMTRKQQHQNYEFNF